MARHAAQRPKRAKVAERIGVASVAILCFIGAVALGAAVREVSLWAGLLVLVLFVLVGLTFAVWATRRVKSKDVQELVFPAELVVKDEAQLELLAEGRARVQEFQDEDR